MRRTARLTVLAASAVLCAGSAAGWVRSYRTVDMLTVTPAGAWFIADRGRLTVEWATPGYARYQDAGETWRTWRTLPAPPPGYGRGRSEKASGWVQDLFGFGYGPRETYGSAGVRYAVRRYWIPYWIVVAAAGGLGVMLCARRATPRHPAGAETCRRCGSAAPGGGCPVCDGDEGGGPARRRRTWRAGVVRVLPVAWLLLAVGPCGMWVRSYWIGDLLLHRRGALDAAADRWSYGSHQLASGCGMIYLARQDGHCLASEQRSYGRDVDRHVRMAQVRPWVRHAVEPRSGCYLGRPATYHLGYSHLGSAARPGSRQAVWSGLGSVYARDADAWRTSAHETRVLRIPWAAPALAAALPWVAWAANRRWRRHVWRRRRAAGLCHRCGYDVRFSPSGRCPECGTPVAAFGEPGSAAVWRPPPGDPS